MCEFFDEGLENLGARVGDRIDRMTHAIDQTLLVEGLTVQNLAQVLLDCFLIGWIFNIPVSYTHLEEVQRQQAHELVDKLFDGSPSSLVVSLLGDSQKLPDEEIERLRGLIDALK